MDRPEARRRAGRRGLQVRATTLLTAVLLLAACSAEPRQVRSDGASTATATAPTAPGDADAVGRLPAPLPAPTDDAESQRSALDLATAVVTAFARPELAQEPWWADLAPMLTPAATEAYLGTDPAQVPASAVTGAAWWGESPSSYLAMVFVPTDAGDYAVLLAREGGGAPWLVERISQVQPEGGEASSSASGESGT
jgi:hypothetical protein